MSRKSKYRNDEDRAAAKREYDLTYKRIHRPSRRKTARVSIERPFEVPIGIVLDRDMRAAAADRRTVSQVHFGDPPPGYSALDQKNGHAR